MRDVYSCRKERKEMLKSKSIFFDANHVHRLTSSATYIKLKFSSSVAGSEREREGEKMRSIAEC